MLSDGSVESGSHSDQDDSSHSSDQDDSSRSGDVEDSSHISGDRDDSSHSGDREDSSHSGDREDSSHSGGDREDSSHSGGDREDSPAARRSSRGGDREANATLDKLLRDFRILKRERRKRQLYTTHCQDEIRKQQQEVDKLRRRHCDLQQSLVAAEGVQDAEHAERLAVLLEMDETEDAIERERCRQTELDGEIAGVLRTLKKKEHTMARQSGRAGLNRKQVRSLDYQLDLTRTYLDEQVTQNVRLRDELDILRKVRVHFKGLHGRLEGELEQVRHEVMELTDHTNATYEARVRAQLEAKTLRRKEAQELVRDHGRRKEETEGLELERRRDAFVRTKNRSRTSPGDDERAWVGGGGDSIQTLEEVFLRVRAAVGEPDLKPDRVVWRYTRGEEVNSEFTVCIGDQTDEGEELKTHTAQVEEAITFMTREDAEATQRHLTLMEQTEARQLDLDEKLKSVEFMLRATAPTMNQFQDLSDSILNTVARREKTKLDDELGKELRKKEEHLMTYMDLVEQKTDDLLKWQADLVRWQAVRSQSGPAHL